MAFELPPLPYAEDALEPAYSARTISFHYGKHHKTYVDTLNKLVEGTDLAGKSLEDVIMAVAGKPDKQPVFNNAAQVWNHTFYWESLKPGGSKPTAAIEKLLAQNFGSLDSFKEKFSDGRTWKRDSALERGGHSSPAETGRPIRPPIRVGVQFLNFSGNCLMMPSAMMSANINMWACPLS